MTTYSLKGNYLVRLKVISMQDCESSHDSTIAIQMNGIAITNISDDVKLYPNPARNEVHVLGLTDHARITLMDATGRIILMPDSKDNSINTSNLSKGIYLVNIFNEQMNITKKAYN